MREKLIALSLVKKGNWDAMYRFLQGDRKLKSIDERIACQWVEQLDCEVVTIVDDDYPVSWREMPKPPFVVYLKGNRQLLGGLVVALVGGKSVSKYAKRAVVQLIEQLPEKIHIATGFERGVEAYANQYAKSRIVCLASGFLTDELYHKQVAYHQLNDRDLVISELPPNGKFSLQAYYRVYHLISELSQVICVFELPSFDSRVKYLNYLTEVGKQTIVLPNKKNEYTAGGLGLINRGAKCLMQVGDVLDCFKAFK